MTPDVHVGRCDACLTEPAPVEQAAFDLYVCGACRADPDRAADLIEALAPGNELDGWYQDAAARLRRITESRMP